ncbi:hypothetical protein LPJ66_009998, partial [Kickxella alabastrina]
MFCRSFFGSQLSSISSLLGRQTTLSSATGGAMSAQRQLLHSSSAHLNQAPYIIPQPQYEQPMIKPEEKRPNVMKVIEREALARADVDGRSKLFIRRAAPKARLCAGDVVFVETQNSMSDPAATTSFTGVCIAIYRRGIDTSFILRN